ncbi:hypothetical protein MIMGU_mgv1a0123772mg, partial [Erythranthe guttata]
VTWTHLHRWRSPRTSSPFPTQNRNHINRTWAIPPRQTGVFRPSFRSSTATYLHLPVFRPCCSPFSGSRRRLTPLPSETRLLPSDSRAWTPPPPCPRSCRNNWPGSVDPCAPARPPRRRNIPARLDCPPLPPPPRIWPSNSKRKRR